MTWRVSWQCSSTVDPCDNAKIEIPIPVSSPDGVPVVTGDWSATGAAGFTASNQIVPDGAGGYKAVWTFISPLPAGSSGQVNLVLRSQNLITPDGNTYTPVATMTADNAPTVNVTGKPVTVTSTAKVKITKTRIGLQPGQPGLPVPTGTNVTYKIDAWQPDTPYGFAPPVGTAGIQDMVVVDHLPAGAVFVSAEDGGVYDPVAHTVTWTVLNTTPAVNNDQGLHTKVTVMYPAVTFADGDSVTNTADVTAEPYLRPNAAALTDNASLTHTLTESGSGAPAIEISKTGTYEATNGTDSPRGSRAGWQVRVSNTASAVAGDFKVSDVFPCEASNTPVPTGTCTDAYVHDNIIYISGNAGSGPTSPVTVTYTTSTGATGSRTFTSYAFSAWYTLPASEGWITSATVTGTLEGEEALYISFDGYTAVSQAVPGAAPSGTTYMRPVSNLTTGAVQVENCLTTQQFGPVGGPLTDSALNPAVDCGNVVIAPQAPVSYPLKGISPSSLAPGDTATVSLTQYSYATDGATLVHQLIDLLPAEMEYVGPVALTGSVTSPKSDAVVEVVKDYQGTGRTLVRVTWPASDLAPFGDYVAAEFQVRVAAGVSVGTHTNNLYTGDAANSPVLACFLGRLEDDTMDLDGDGSTSDKLCVTSANFNVLSGGGVMTAKSVKGSFDSSFVAPPGTGETAPGAPATFRLDITNSGNVDEKNFVSYDLLPKVGDTGSGPATEARGSDWQALLTGVPTVPSGFTVEYSTSANPCRGDVLSAGGAIGSAPAGCTNDWSSTPPLTIGNTTALRFSYAGVLKPLESVRVEFPVTSPATATGTAWNSAATTAQRVDDATWLLPTESPKVGLEIPIDLEVHKSANPAPGSSVFVGMPVTYTVTTTNKGPAPATGVKIADKLPAGVTYLSHSTSAGSYDPTTGEWSVGTLAVGKTVSLTVVGFFNATGGTVTNNAEVSAANEHDVDSTPGNCATGALEDDCDAVTHTVLLAAPTVEIIKDTNGQDADVAPGPQITVGDPVTWTYKVTNTGNTPLSDVKVTDDKVAGSKIDCGGGSNVVAGPLAPGETFTCTAKGVATMGQYENTGTVVGTSPPTVDQNGNPVLPAKVTDDNPSHYFGRATKVLPPTPSYVVEKHSDPGTGSKAEPGEKVTYTVTIHNTGGTALDPTITDDLSKVLDDADYNDDAKASTGPAPVLKGNTLSWTGPLKVGATVKLTYSVTVKAYDDQGDHTLHNVVAGNGPIDRCEPCHTDHSTERPHHGILPNTGGPTRWVLEGGVLALLVGLVLLAGSRRRRS